MRRRPPRYVQGTRNGDAGSIYTVAWKTAMLRCDKHLLSLSFEWSSCAGPSSSAGSVTVQSALKVNGASRGEHACHLYDGILQIVVCPGGESNVMIK